MSIPLLLRPDVSRLMFRVYSGPVHPEFFDIAARFSTELTVWRAKFWLCREGHVLQFQAGTHTLTELLTVRDRALPDRRQLLSRYVRANRSEQLSEGPGPRYATSFQLEQVEPDVFPRLHEELLADSSRVQIVHQFGSTGGPRNRLTVPPLSYMRLEVLPDGLIVHSYHTFPENHAIVKVQSLFEP